METSAKHPLSYPHALIGRIVAATPRHIRCKHIALLFEVAQSPGLTVSELSALHPYSLATTAKLVHELTHESWRRDKRDDDGIRRLPGYGFLRLQADLRDHRTKRVFLSEKGEHLINDLLSITGPFSKGDLK